MFPRIVTVFPTNIFPATPIPPFTLIDPVEVDVASCESYTCNFCPTTIFPVVLNPPYIISVPVPVPVASYELVIPKDNAPGNKNVPGIVTVSLTVPIMI